MRINFILTSLAVIFFSNLTFSQNNYWTESFESTNIPGSSSTVYTTPTDVTLPSGVWKMYWLYRGSVGVCDGKPLRFLSNTTAGLNGPTFAVTPTFSNGVGQLFFVENSAAPRTVTISKSTDNGATFTLLQTVTTRGATCDTTILTINDATITKLKFSNETGSNIGLDNMKVSKNGTLLDGTVVVVTPTDTASYYPDTTLLPAFPGAEGAGKYTRGGRGGVIVEVTNLEDDAAGSTVGSFRWAQRQNTGPKTIVFRVSGTIHLKDALSFARGDVTIAGQTAPGDGIAFADFPITIGKKNIIMRHIRFRLGDIGIQRTGYASSAGDAVNSSGGINADSIIIDHCTSSWSIDEAATFKNMTHFTMQNCLISEPLNQSEHSGELHGYGGIWGGVNASFHHNLFAHCSSRNCRFNGSRQYDNGEKDTVDYRNNVIYDWGINSVNGGEGGFYNIVNNYYKPGPSTNASVISRTVNPYKDATLPYPKIYMTGNIMTSSAAITQSNWLGAKMEDGTAPYLADTVLSKVDRQIKTYRVTSQSAQDAYNYVLANAGATMPKRDTLDQRIINDVINGTGRIIDVQGGYPAFTDTSLTKSAWPTLLSRTAPVDNDHDGMADEWETQRGLNPAVATDRNGVSLNGYTHLENYLNGDSIVAKGISNTCVPVPGITATGSNTWLNLKDTSYVRLISTDTSNLVAAIKDASTYGGFSASYYTTNNNRTFNGKVYLNRNITITASNPAAITAPVTVRLYFTKAEFDTLKAANTSINSLSDLRVLKISNNSCANAITDPVTEITPSTSATYGTYANGYYIEFSTQTFGTFFIGSANNPLPLSLLTFKGSYNGKDVKTEWTTTNEVNTKDYTVERSADAQTFKSIGTVPSRNVSANQTYNFTDVAPLPGLSYYRLKMTDIDNRFTFSQVIAINIKTGNNLNIFPNPVHNNIIVSHPKATNGATIQIISADGKKVMSYKTSENSIQTSVITISLKPGIYYLTFENNGEKMIEKFVKQ